MEKWYTEEHFGMFIHWGIYALLGKGEWARFYDDTYVDPMQFDPKHFDPDAWAQMAWDAGMRYVVFTTKHHDGFCMFDSHYTDYKVTNTPFGKDVTRMVVESFRKRGLKIGLYHSLIDWHHPHYRPDLNHPAGRNGETDFPEVQDELYRKYLYDSVEQLMTEYGKIDILFWDYCTQWKTPQYFDPDRLVAMIRRHQPHILINDRMTFDRNTDFAYTGDYKTPECCVPNTPPSRYWETCASATASWGYLADDHTEKDVNAFTAGLMACIAQGGNLLLNFSPDADGQITKEGVSMLDKLKVWHDHNGEAIHGTHKSSFPAPFMHCMVQKGKYVYLYIPFQPMAHILLPEMRGVCKSATVLRTGEECPVSGWGLEHATPFEYRLTPKPAQLQPGDVVRIETDEAMLFTKEVYNGSMQ